MTSIFRSLSLFVTVEDVARAFAWHFHCPSQGVSDGSKRILVVEDDEAIRTMVERVLRHEDLEVDCARDGFEAIEKLSRNDYATVVLDLAMPRADGIDVLRFMEREKPQVKRKVIVMSADLPELEALKAKRVAGVLTKPFDIRALIEQIRDQPAA
jgi:DNA-binding response OmpR family regulator